MSIPDQHLKNVCRLKESSKECRYIASFEDGTYQCLKNTERKSIIDNEVGKFLDLCKKQGKSLIDTGKPIGDNCPGI